MYILFGGRIERRENYMTQRKTDNMIALVHVKKVISFRLEDVSKPKCRDFQQKFFSIGINLIKTIIPGYLIQDTNPVVIIYFHQPTYYQKFT